VAKDLPVNWVGVEEDARGLIGREGAERGRPLRADRRIAWRPDGEALEAHAARGRVDGRDEGESTVVEAEQEQRTDGAQVVGLEHVAGRLDVDDREGEATESRQRADDLEHALLVLDRDLERRDLPGQLALGAEGHAPKAQPMRSRSCTKARR